MYSDITEEEVLRLLRPQELVQRRRAEREAAVKRMEERAAEAKDGEGEGGEDAGDDGAGDADGAAEEQALEEMERMAAAEAQALEDAACDNPSDEAARREKIVRGIVLGEDGVDGETAGGSNDDSERTAVLMDYLVGSLHFAELQGLNNEQASVVFAIAKRLFSYARNGENRGGAPDSSSADEGKQAEKLGKVSEDEAPSPYAWVSVEAAYRKFTEMVKAHAMPMDELDGRRVFGADDVASLTKYFATTFFRHYKSYEHAFTYEREVETVQNDVVVQTPMLPPLLAEATEVVVTEAEKKAEAERQRQAAEWDHEEEDDAEKMAALEAADAALNALDSGGGSGSKSSADGDDDELDERLERAIDERVRAQTQMLEQKLDDLRELAESINDEDCD